MKKLRIGIVGYGNLGKGVEQAIAKSPDMELAAIFSRRSLEASVPVYALSALGDYREQLDLLILCGGSASDLPAQTPELAEQFNVIDSFDTHAEIPKHFAAVDAAARRGGKTALISCGWDPGLFSLNRVLAAAILPEGETYTFWGKGVSQGHSSAILQVPGVKRAVQYSVPEQAALDQVRAGGNPRLTTRDKHQRICYVVPQDGADTAAIEQAIVTMPHYFAAYNTTVHFIGEEEFLAAHTAMPHGGFVIHTTADDPKQRMEFQLELASNPAFTGAVLVAYARAVGRMAAEGKAGGYSVLDIPFGYLSPLPREELIAKML
ncbi:MAG: diaminopimelate dehydrogenase [Oscillospiraceae bacterium]|nr:diaminopimelate dehydrogenase [Oscillospiraceae bacterium]